MTLTEAWWEYLQTVRWFGGKGAAGRVSQLTAFPPYNPGATPVVRSEIAEIAYDDGRIEHYHLLVASYPEGTAPIVPVASSSGEDLVDATRDPDAVAAFVAACQSDAVPGMSWTHRQPPVKQAKVFAGEQSNTTIAVDQGSLFKLFRKIEPGSNLDADVLTALDGTAAAVPAMLGRLVGAWPEGQTTDLGMVIARVTDAEDGWEVATHACASGEDFSERAQALGRELAVVHGCLRGQFGTEAASGDALADLMAQRLDLAAEIAPDLAAYRSDLILAFDTLRGRSLQTQRVHGDFHLGQTLIAHGAWTIIDFEGEPAKTAAERRAFDSVLRDVAGMLRSFDYARSAHAEPGGEQARAWSAAASQAFLAGYGETQQVEADVLSAYIVDKAIYEVVYETRNRPKWAHIPLTAVHDEARRAGSGRPTRIEEH